MKLKLVPTTIILLLLLFVMATSVNAYAGGKPSDEKPADSLAELRSRLNELSLKVNALLESQNKIFKVEPLNYTKPSSDPDPTPIVKPKVIEMHDPVLLLQNPIVGMYTEWSEQRSALKQLNEIDEWIKKGRGEYLEWLDIAGADADDVARALRQEIEPGLTYLDHCMIIMETIEIIDIAIMKGGISSYHYGSGAMGSFLKMHGAEPGATILNIGLNTLGGKALVLKSTMETLGAVSSVSGWAEVMSELNEAQYTQALGYYFRYRQGIETYEETWTDLAERSLMGAFGRYDERDFEILEAQFGAIYDQYEEHSKDRGKWFEYRDDVRNEVMSLIRYAVEER